MDIDERWKDISRIYDAALERTGDERATFVATACGTDEALRREVESLLSCDSDVNDLLKAPAGDVMAKAIDVMAKAMAADAGSLLGRQVRVLPNRRTTRRRRDGRGLQGDATRVSLRAGRASKSSRSSLPPTLDPATALRPVRRRRLLRCATRTSACCTTSGRHDGIDFLVMEYLEGETLAERLTRGPLPVDELFRCAIEIADALVATHHQGITHRDLKPGNVMLTPSGAKLLDFGLATLRSAMSSTALGPVTDDSSAPPAAILGTPSYMAPEQLQGLASDHRTDIFAFGALLYEMITGRKAFDGKSRTELAAAIMTSEPAPMADNVPPAAQRLVPLLRRCLAKDPNQRWQNTSDLASELRQLTDNAINAGAVVPAWHARIISGVSIAAVLAAWLMPLTDQANQGKAFASHHLHHGGWRLGLPRGAELGRTTFVASDQRV